MSKVNSCHIGQRRSRTFQFPRKVLLGGGAWKKVFSLSHEGDGHSRVRGGVLGGPFGEKRGVVHLGPLGRAGVPPQEDAKVGGSLQTLWAGWTLVLLLQQ